MSASISFDNLNDGQEVLLPFVVNGRIVAQSAGTPRVVGASRRIDDNALLDIGPNCGPPLPDSPTDFSFELTEQECPQTNSNYLLTIRAFDSMGPAATEISVTFRRAGPVLPGPGGTQ